MTEPHDRFLEWLAAGAEGEPPRDLALHASVCAECQRAIAAFDQLASIDPSRARFTEGGRAAPAEAANPTSIPVGRLIGAAAAVIFSLVILVIGATQLIALTGTPVALASGTPTARPSEVLLTPGPVPSFDLSTPTPSPSPTPTPIPTPKPTAPPAKGSPGAPTGLKAVVTVGHITLSWSAADNGGSRILRFYIYRDGSGTIYASTTARNWTDTVGNGATHAYRITAVNALGVGPYSNPVTATTPSVPGTPGTLVATAGIGQIALTWSAPSWNGGSPIIRYDIYRQGTLLVSTGSPSYTDTSAGNGATFSYYVKAHNAVGDSAQTNTASASTPNVPGAPTSVVATAGNGQIVLSWSAPASDGGSSITGYQVFRDDLGTTVVCSTTGALTCANSALGPGDGPHTYTVKAANAVGAGSASTASNPATTWAVPGAPASVTATAGNKTISVTWTAPASNGGSAIMNYDVYEGATLKCPATTTQPCVISGLGDGETHTYTVRARNVIGLGAGTSDTATTWAVPGAAGNVVASDNQSLQVTVTWTAAVSNCTCAVTYDVYRDGVLQGSTATLSYVDSDPLLVPLTSYSYYVIARNVIGSGPQSASDTGTPQL